MSSSLAVLLEVKTTHSSAVLSLHLSQCFTPPLKSIPASFFPHAPCPPSWISILPAILTPILRMCHPFKTTLVRRQHVAAAGRVQGLPIRDCAGSCNSSVQMCTTMKHNRCDSKGNLLGFVFGSRTAHICAHLCCHCPHRSICG